MHSVRRFIVGAAVALCAVLTQADTCSSVAASTNIELKKRFELKYTSKSDPVLHPIYLTPRDAEPTNLELSPPWIPS